MAVTPAYTTEAAPADERDYASEGSAAANRAYNNARTQSFSARGELSRELEDINPETDFAYSPESAAYLKAVNDYLNTQSTGYNLTPMNLGTAVDRQTGAAMPLTNAQLSAYAAQPLEDQFYANFNYSAPGSEWDVGNLQFAPNQQYRIVDRSTGDVLYEGSGYEAGKEVSRLANDLYTKSGKMADWAIQSPMGEDGAWENRYHHDPETDPALMATLGIMAAMTGASALFGAGFGGAGTGAGLGAGAGGTGGVGAGGVGGLGALNSAISTIAAPTFGLGGITVVAPTALGTGTLIGGGLGLGGMAGLSQLANPVASTGASTGSAPFDGITVSHAPIGGLTAAELEAIAASAAGVGAATIPTASGAASTAAETGANTANTVSPNDIVVNAPTGTIPPALPPAAIGAITVPELVPNLSGLEALGNTVPTQPPASTGAPPVGAIAAGAAGASSALSGATNPTNGMDLSDYLTLGSLAIGGLGNLFGGGGGGSNGTIPAGFGSGSNGTFNQPLPTLPSTSPFSPQNLGARNVSKTYDEWTKGGYGSPTSYFNNVPLQSTPSVTQPYTKPAASVAMPDVRIPTLASVPTPRAPGADLLAAMLGQQDQTTGMARGGQAHGHPSRSTDSFAVRGAGTGREDKIPAVLSDGEYVMDAETVALLGDGSTDAGAQKLDQFRVNIRKHKGRKLAKGKFSANAKRPDAYLAGGLS